MLCCSVLYLIVSAIVYSFVDILLPAMEFIGLNTKLYPTHNFIHISESYYLIEFI